MAECCLESCRLDRYGDGRRRLVVMALDFFRRHRLSFLCLKCLYASSYAPGRFYISFLLTHQDDCVLATLFLSRDAELRCLSPSIIGITRTSSIRSLFPSYFSIQQNCRELQRRAFYAEDAKLSSTYMYNSTVNSL